MAGQINISGNDASCQLVGNDNISKDQIFTFPDKGGTLRVVLPSGEDPNDPLPIASDTVLGAVRIGRNVSIVPTTGTISTPDVNNGRIVIVQPGTDNQNFTVNQVEDATITLITPDLQRVCDIGSSTNQRISCAGLTSSASITASAGITVGGGIELNTNGTATFDSTVTTGNLSAATGTFSGNISGKAGSFSGNISASAGTFSGNVSGKAASFTGDVTAYASSDIALKKNIKPIESALDKVKQLNGITYNWTDEHMPNREAGVVAQEVQKVLPEIVTTREDGYLAIRYERLVPLLIEAIKELEQRG